MPVNSYRQQHHSPVDEYAQPRSLSVSQTHLQGTIPEFRAQRSPAWPEQQNIENFNAQWPQQQHMGADQQQVINIDSLFTQTRDLLQNHHPGDAPWNAHGFHQHDNPRFDKDQFLNRLPGTKTLPDVRSFEDSAYCSETPQNQPAHFEGPLEELSNVAEDLSHVVHAPSQSSRPQRACRKQARSVVSDSQVQKKSKRSTTARQTLRCKVCGKSDLKNKSDLK